MPRLNVANNASTTLVNSMTSYATSMTLADVSLFPAPPFLVTIDDEIIEVGTVTGASKQFSNLKRGQEGTVAASHSSGAEVGNRFTAGTWVDMGIYTDEAITGDFAGVKYKLVVEDGEPFLEVVEVD